MAEDWMHLEEVTRGGVSTRKGDGRREATGGEGFGRKAAGVDKGGWECFGL